MATCHAERAARGQNLARLLEIIDVVVPETRRYALAGQLVLHDAEYRFTGLHGRFGDSDLAGALTVDNTDPRVRIDATLATRRLDILDAVPVIGYNPDLVASLGVRGAIRQTPGGQRLLPDAPLRIAALKAFDAGPRWHVDAVRSRNVPLSDIDLQLSLDHNRVPTA